MIIDLLEDMLGEGTKNQKGNECRWDCPFCGDTRGRFYYNLSKQTVYCHNCQYSTTVIKFISEFQGITYNQAFMLFKNYNGVLRISENVLDELYDKLRVKPSLNLDINKQVVPLPEEFVLLDKSKSFVSKQVRRYLHSRGVTNRQITAHGWGYCFGGIYDKRAILTIYENGSLKFWVARSIDKKASRKELSPSNENWQIGKSEVIFNLDGASSLFDSIAITEGIFDATTFGDLGCAMLGKIVSEHQLSLIIEYKDQLSRGIYIALDEDAKRQSYELADSLFRLLTVPVYICNIFGDPNDMGKERCLESLELAEEYSPIKSIKSRLMNI
jgi:hypothetical protein